MTDISDKATEREELDRANALAAQRQRAVMGGSSLSHCEECGEEIPAARRVALPGVRLCVGCQSEIEQKRRLRK
ncbi:MAG: transcriptional regulator, TraR/DksA family [Burkholderiaceae bacterium]|nr:transcriptional regulator, TraR/DksA family [Burkholderiaceae bacterium]